MRVYIMVSPSKNKQPGPAFSLEMKVGILLVLILGVGGLVLGVRYVGVHLQKPFYSVLYYDGPEYLTLSEQEQQEIELQKSSDSDEDGLSDYDELNIYKTSPYLADSDSDGQDDMAEINSGQNPNCPEGRDCGYYFAADNDTSDELGADDIIDGIPGSTIEEPDAHFQSEEDVMSYLQEMSAEQVRLALIEAGVPEATVNALDDETLLEVFGEAINDAGESGQLSDVVDQYNVQSEKLCLDLENQTKNSW